MADTKASAFSGIGTWTALADGDLFPFVDISGTGAAKNSVATYLEIKTALSTVLLPKAGGTMTGALINSTNGAASTPSLLLSGTPFTGGSATTTKPLVNIETAGATSTGWSTSGTMLGVNAPSGFAGNLFSFQTDGTRKLWCEAGGDLWVGNSVQFGDFGLNTQCIANHGGNGLLFNAEANYVTKLRADGFRMQSASQYLINDGSSYSGTPVLGFARTSDTVARISNGGSGRATLDAAGYQVGGVAGANFGPGAVTSITVVNGIITAIS